MRRCINCGKSCEESHFVIVDFDDRTEEFVVGDRCRECACIGEEPDAECDADAETRNQSDNTDDGDGVDSMECMARKLAFICGNDLKMISRVGVKAFRDRTSDDISDKQFETVRHMAIELSKSSKGMEYERELTMPPGMYIVVSDSHGVHENEGAAAVVSTAANNLGARIVHVGHALDIHGHISSIADRDGTIVVALPEEIHSLVKLNAANPSFTLSRGNVTIGDVVIRSQVFRTDSATGVGKNISVPDTGCAAIIVNRHFHEMFTLTKHDHNCRLITPGCLCDEHVIRKVPRRIPSDISMEQVVAASFERDRSGARQKEIAKTWEKGMIIIHVDSLGRSTIYPTRIKKTKLGWASAFGRTVFMEDCVRQVEKVGLVIGDAHVPCHDPGAIDVVDRVASIIVPEYFVNLGDHIDCTSLNHHRLDRGEQITGGDIANECGKGKKILEAMANWAKELYFLVGNHTRFISDFYKKYPQLENLMNHHSTLCAEELGYEILELKSVLVKDGAKFIHGDMKIYGAVGADRHDKIASTMERETMVGHCHNPSIRKGVYYVGMLGRLNQQYNEVNASNWMHGFGLVCHFGGEIFMTTIGFEGCRLNFMGREIRGDSGSSRWNPPDYEAKVVYRQKK